MVCKINMIYSDGDWECHAINKYLDLKFTISKRIIGIFDSNRDYQPCRNMAKTNFHYLEEEYALLYNLAQAAEYNLYQDPATSLFKLRQYGEYMAKQIFDTYGMELPEDTKFQNLVYILRNQGIIPSNVTDHFTILRKQGNDAVH